MMCGHLSAKARVAGLDISGIWQGRRLEEDLHPFFLPRGFDVVFGCTGSSSSEMNAHSTPVLTSYEHHSIANHVLELHKEKSKKRLLGKAPFF
jgi:hypothetical protein